jgi:hypothetical protein
MTIAVLSGKHALLFQLFQFINAPFLLSQCCFDDFCIRQDEQMWLALN